MKSTRGSITLAAVILVFAALPSLLGATERNVDADKDQSDIVKRIDAAANVLKEVMGTPDKAIPDKIFSDAKCIAVVPSMIKIAVGFGGNHGKGIATCKTGSGWSAPAPISVTGGSWGLQLGGQAIDLVMLVMNQRGMDSLLASKFKIRSGCFCGGWSGRA